MLEGTTDEANVVRRTAAATRLGHDDRSVIEVVLSRVQRIHDLTDHDDGRVAGIVVHVLETRIDRCPVCVVQNFDLITAGADGRLDQLEVDRGHLRAEDGVALVLHVLRKELSIIAGRTQRTLVMLLLPDTDRRDQRTHTDTCRAEVVDLIDLQHGVDLIGTVQNIPYLIHGDGIEAAAEGVQLDEIEVLAGLHEGSRAIETGVVHPLVRDDERTLHLAEMGDGILGQHREVVARDQLRDTMVDFRIHVVRTTREHDPAVAGLLHPAEGFLTLLLHILMRTLELCPGLMRRRADLLLGEVPLLKLLADLFKGELADRTDRILDAVRMDEDLHELVCADLLVRQCEERFHEEDGVVLQVLDVIDDVLRIGGDHRAVVVIAGIRRLVPLIWDARVPDELLAVLHQPLDVTVCDLRRIALGLGRDRLDAELVDLTCAGRGQHGPELQLTEEGRPERIVFVHVEDARDTHLATLGEIDRERLVIKHALHLISEEVRNVRLRLRLSEATLTAVTGDEVPAGTELVDGQDAVVVAALAACHAGRILEVDNVVDRKHAGLHASVSGERNILFLTRLHRTKMFVLQLITLACDQCCAEGTHDAGDIRTGDMGVEEVLEGAEDGIVIEGTTLHDDVLSEILRIRNLDDLIECVLDDGVGEAGRDIADACPLLLRLLDVRVHEYRTAGAEVGRVLCIECLVREVDHGVVQ